jgi:flagellar hook-associated protein 3 FlgL
MRVTFDPVRDGMPSINQAASAFAEAQWQVSSGKRLRAPSDDPAAAQRIVGEHASMAGVDAYQRAADSAASRLTSLDSSLGDIVNQLSTGMTAAASAQGSTATQTVRDAAAATLGGVRDAIAADINASFNGSYLFGGSKSTTKPYDNSSGSWVYQGDNQSVTNDIDNGRSVTLATSGQAILQGSDATDVLSSIDALITAVQAGTNPAAIQSGMDALKRAFDRATHAQSLVGIDEKMIDDGNQRLQTQQIAAKTLLSSDEDANVAEAMTKMAQAQTTYRAALGAVGAASQVSLMDYITTK